MEKLVLQKNADNKKNRIVIPKFFVKKYGYQFYMEIYNDTITIRPVKKKEGK